MAERKIEFVNTSGTPWVIKQLGITIPESTTWDVTDYFRDFEIIGAIQRGLSADFDSNHILKVNGTALSAESSSRWGNCATRAGWPYLNADEEVPDKFLPWNRPGSFRDGTGGQSISGTPTTLNLDTESMPNALYSLSGDEITIEAAGIYWINYRVSYEVVNLGGSTYGSVKTHVEEDQGVGSWQEILDSVAYVSHSEDNEHFSLGTGFPCQLAAGDKIRVRLEQVDGSTSVQTTQHHSHLSIIKVDG